MTVKSQIKQHSVALISLVIALYSLGYNTWRNELTEYNRNQRIAAFEMLLKLNALQEVVFYNRYDKDATNKGNPRTGWTYVLTINDLSRVLHEPLPESAEQLQKIWAENWQLLTENQASADAVLSGIDATRGEVILLLKTLH